MRKIILVAFAIVVLGGVVFYFIKDNFSQNTKTSITSQIDENNKTLFYFDFSKCVLSKSTDLTNWEEQKIDRSVCDKAELLTNVVSFKDKFWIVGGSSLGGDEEIPYKDILVSDDGINWNVAVKNFPYGGYSHKVLVFNDNLWVFYYGSDNAYYSSDGTTWETAKLPTDWGTSVPVDNTVTFNDKLWLFSESIAWSSSDGITWNKSQTFGFEKGRLVEFNGKLFLLRDVPIHQMATNNVILSTSDSNEIKFSDNGIHWTILDYNPEWSGRRGYSLFVFDNKIWVAGGVTYGEKVDGIWPSSSIMGEMYGKRFSDLWSSANGKDWINEQLKSIPKYDDFGFNGFHPVIR